MYKVIVDNLDYTDKLAKITAQIYKKQGGLICLFGDIGAGKTTFVKYVGKYLNIKEKITSPSFIILNEYYSGDIPLYHFDLYRLEKEGIESIIDELEEYTQSKDSLAMVEWAEFSQETLPRERLEIKINYIDEKKREFEFNAYGERSKNTLMQIKMFSFIR